jgi:hypothetical protein
VDGLQGAVVDHNLGARHERLSRIPERSTVQILEDEKTETAR